MASELRMWPPIWKSVRGRVTRRISFEGGRIPYFRKGRVDLRRGYRCARKARKMHQVETKRNWMRVRVMGLGKALRMAFEEVLLKMEVMYHIPQSIYIPYISCQRGGLSSGVMMLGGSYN